jgi:hypothetical protein
VAEFDSRDQSTAKKPTTGGNVNTYIVRFKDNTTMTIKAERHRLENDQYVFESDNDTDVRFVKADDVRAIDIVDPNLPRVFTPPVWRPPHQR